MEYWEGFMDILRKLNGTPEDEDEEFRTALWAALYDRQILISTSVEHENKWSCNRDSRDILNPSRRVALAPARLVRRLNLLPLWKDQQLSDFLGKHGFVGDYRIIRGEGIVEHYRDTKNTSCMTGGSSRYVEVYAMNPDKVALYTLNGFRCLIFTADSGEKIAIRAYGDCAFMTRYCESEGVLRPWVASELAVICGLTVTLQVEGVNYMPYIDLFQHGQYYKEREEVTLFSHSKARPEGGLLCSFGRTNGIVPWISKVECYSCGEHIHEADAHDGCGEFYCDDCFGEHFTICEECGITIPADDATVVESDVLCPTCLRRLYAVCDECGEFTLFDEVRRDSDGHRWCGDCYAEHHFECDECGCEVHEDDGQEGLCDGCYGNIFVGCAACRTIVDTRKDNLQCGMCPDCYEETMQEDPLLEEALLLLAV